jgi:hypothetical protein
MPPKKYVGPRSTAAAPPARRRGRVEKEWPEGMTNAEWAFDLQRRQVENASRRQRELRAFAVAVFGNNPGWADVPGQPRYAPALSLLSVHAARHARHLQPQ